MLVWSSSFLPDPRHSFLVTRSFFPKSERLCLFGKELHLYPSLNYTWKWYHTILPVPVSFTSLGMIISTFFSMAEFGIISYFFMFEKYCIVSIICIFYN